MLSAWLVQVDCRVFHSCADPIGVILRHLQIPTFDSSHQIACLPYSNVSLRRNRARLRRKWCPTGARAPGSSDEVP